MTLPSDHSNIELLRKTIEHKDKIIQQLENVIIETFLMPVEIYDENDIEEARVELREMFKQEGSK